MAPTTVTIEYAKAGTLPPIYLAGSFSDPAWHPEEMEYTIKEDGEHEFHKELQVEEGKEYQYKFRIGDGDWWILDENAPTVTDNIGNRNNLLSIPKDEESKQKMEQVKKISDAPAVESKPIAEATGETKPAGSTLNIAQTHQHETTQITPAVELVDPLSAAISTIENAQIADVGEPKDHLQNGSAATKEVNKEGETAKLNLTCPNFLADSTSASVEELTTSNKSAIHEERNAADAKMTNEISPPTVVVEKVDLTPHHGDDFGPNATSAQKHAHDTHALDATPDYVLLRNQSNTPDFVTTASEVADVAATLDRELPTPPISDEEAGRIGYRRMSSTPIPEVAKTAAEVADVAASLDSDFLPLIIQTPAFDHTKEELIDSGRSTPANEKVPRFSHECCELPDHTEPCHHEPIESLPEERPLDEGSSEEIDFNDPSIQMFPTERNEILAKLVEIQQRLPEDETNIDGVPPSPVVGPNYRSNSNSQLQTPSPGMRSQERSSSLHSISEEVERDGLLSHTDVPMANGGQTLDSLNELEEPVGNRNHGNGHIQEPAQNQKQDTSVISENQRIVAQEIRGASLPVDSQAEPTLDQEPAMSAIFESQHIATQENPKQSCPTVTEIKPNGYQETPKSPISQRHEVSLMSDGSADDNTKIKLPEEQHRVEVQEVHPETPPSRSPSRSPNRQMKFGSLAQNAVPAVTPFVVGNRQLGEDDKEIRTIDTGIGPSINVMPATPGGSSTRINNIPILDDAAKSTAVQKDQTEARQRKQPVPERPLTPSSMRSAGKDAKDRNFLKAFWHVVFIDWIGGLIMKLCGGVRRRQKTLLAVIAIVGCAVAPTLYFSEPAREVALQSWKAVADSTTKYWQDWKVSIAKWL